MKERFGRGETRNNLSELPDSKQQELVDKLTAAVDAIHDSDDFRRYLAMESTFHQYSWGNILLIMTQRPEATRVAGYNAWLKLHRYVKKGEKSIAIMAPHTRKVAEDEEGKGIFKVTGFGVAHVFDVSQTDGEPLPELAVPTLQGAEGEELYGRLAHLAYEEGTELSERCDFPADAMGFYAPDRRQITVRPHNQTQMTKTLAHELAHAVHLTHFGEESQVRDERETVAEAAAFVVCGAHRLATGERSFPYVAAWAKSRDTMTAALGTIHKVSSHILTGLAAPDAREVKRA